MLSKNDFIGTCFVLLILILSSLSSFSLTFSSSFISYSSLLLPPKLISLILSTIISSPSSFTISTLDWILNSIPFWMELLLMAFFPTFISSSGFFEISKLLFILVLFMLLFMLLFTLLSLLLFILLFMLLLKLLGILLMLFILLFIKLLLFIQFTLLFIPFILLLKLLFMLFKLLL